VSRSLAKESARGRRLRTRGASLDLFHRMGRSGLCRMLSDWRRSFGNGRRNGLHSDLDSRGFVLGAGRSAPASLGLWRWRRLRRSRRSRRSRRGFLRLRIFRIFWNCRFGLCHLLYCHRFFQSIVRVKEIFATEFTILKSLSLSWKDNCCVVMVGMSKKTLVDMEYCCTAP
jgi:hypothetical protein